MHVCALPAIMDASIKILIVEERDLLREKIAGVLSRENNITMVIQVSSYSNLKASLGEMAPDLVLGDYFEFNKFCKKAGIAAGELCPEANILLYIDEDGRLLRPEDIGQKRICNLPRIQKEVRSFLQDAKQKKQND
jgi:hypothetical protein